MFELRLLGSIITICILFCSCSKEDSSNPVNTDKTAVGYVRANIESTNWYSNKIITSKSGNTRTVKATLEIQNDPLFSSSILEFKISVNQTGAYGIGEDEPGYKYYVKAYYTLVSKTGLSDEKYKAYYDNVSLMTINKITDTNLDAVFTFDCRTDDSTKFLSFTTGGIKIDY